MATNAKRRRQLIAGLGTTAAAIAMGTPAAVAQTTSRPFEPSLYPQDDWLGTRPGKHRVVLDTVTANGVADAIRFANNLFNGSKTGYSVDEGDMAIVVCLRHLATCYGYTDALWSKYGRVLERPKRTAAPPAPRRDRQQLRHREHAATVRHGQARRAIHGVRHGQPGGSPGARRARTGTWMPCSRSSRPT